MASKATYEDWRVFLEGGKRRRYQPKTKEIKEAKMIFEELLNKLLLPNETGLARKLLKDSFNNGQCVKLEKLFNKEILLSNVWQWSKCSNS